MVEIVELIRSMIYAILGTHEFKLSVTKEEEDSIRVDVVTQTCADLGKVIGKQGRIAKSIRIILTAVGRKINRKLAINFESEPISPEL